MVIPRRAARLSPETVIPYENGERLFAAANKPKQFLTLRGGHNDGFMVSGENYIQTLDGFIRQSLGE